MSWGIAESSAILSTGSSALYRLFITRYVNTYVQQVIALPLPAATFEPELYPERTEISLTQPVEVRRPGFVNMCWPLLLCVVDSFLFLRVRLVGCLSFTIS